MYLYLRVNMCVNTNLRNQQCNGLLCPFKRQAMLTPSPICLGTLLFSFQPESLLVCLLRSLRYAKDLPHWLHS